MTLSSMDLFRHEFLRRYLIDNEYVPWSFASHWDYCWPPSSHDWCMAQQRLARERRANLDRAARFVLALDRGMRYARAFELLRSCPSLIHHLVSTSDMNKAEAKAAIRKADWFLRENYFIISQIVHHKLECNASSGTQIDQLSTECLTAITKYLKVDDVHQ